MKTSIKQVKTGIITSNKMQKTVVVKVESRMPHPLYKKIVKRIKKFKAHNEIEGLLVGDKVKVESTRPLSKEKRWKVVEKVK